MGVKDTVNRNLMANKQTVKLSKYTNHEPDIDGTIKEKGFLYGRPVLCVMPINNSMLRKTVVRGYTSIVPTPQTLLVSILGTFFCKKHLFNII